jgi:hypothetical protein
MSGPHIEWKSYKGFSGCSIRGNNPVYISPACGLNELVLAACTAPEGGAYDTVVSYDGTGMTWGAAQWTFTSGRLQRLLLRVQNGAPGSPMEDSGIRRALSAVGVNMLVKMDRLELAHLSTKKPITSKAVIRQALTMPGGKVPKDGPLWFRAAEIASAFWALGQFAGVGRVQAEFFADEIAHESGLCRPTLGLKPVAHYFQGMLGGGTLGNRAAAAWALFWAMWQNNPRKAEAHLYRAMGDVWEPSAVLVQRLACVFAHSTFGYWGNEKCKPLKRKSRYQKVATEINRLVGDLLPLDPPRLP